MGMSVKMDDDTKSDLEELQAEIRLKTGRQVTQQEILARIVAYAVQSKEDVIESFRDDLPELGPDDREAFHDGMIASGTRTTEEDIDAELYG